jgi:hypothetical protein
MVKSILLYINIILLLCSALSDAYGQRISDIELTDAVSGEVFSWEQHRTAKGVVLIFSSLTCPFSKLYEGRIASLYENFSPQGFVFALVNPHVSLGASESKENMAKLAREKFRGIPFLVDAQQFLAAYLKVTKIPEAIIITNGPTGYAVVYQGAIDNNPQSPEGAQMNYLENALTNVLARKSPSPASTRAVGCNIRRL